MYNDIIIDNFTNAGCNGVLQHPTCQFEVGNPVCGDRIEVQLVLSGHKIEQAKFQAWGCATSIATANIFCRTIIGQDHDQVSEVQEEDRRSMLGELEPSQQHCVAIMDNLYQQLVDIIEQQGGCHASAEHS